MESSSKRAHDSEGVAQEAQRPPNRHARTFKALRLRGFLDSGNSSFLGEIEGMVGNDALPEEVETDEATAATSTFFMPYAANDDDAAGGVEASVESDDSDLDSDDESDGESDNADDEDQGELQFLNMGRERTPRLRRD